MRLNEALSGDVTLVNAPAGYGKTTLMAEWAEQCPLPVAWLSLDESDNEISSFLTYSIAAIRTIFPEACPTLSALVRGTQPIQSALLPTVLVNEIDDLPQRFTLVLDDYHYITQPLIQELVDILLHRPPTQMHLTIVSRTEPPLALARLRASGMLSEFGIRDLRLTPTESEVLLSQWAGSLDEQVAALVLERAEGWVTGLQLASLTLQSDGVRAAMPRSLADESNRYVADYLFEQVIVQQPPEVQEFLIKTAILKRVSPGLARAVVGPGAAMPTTLVEVERAGLFLHALDNSGEWFVYHTLFRDVLQRVLAETYTPDEIAAFHLSACEWFLQHNLIDDALYHALAADDKPMAARIISSQVIHYLNEEGWIVLERWLKRLPPEIIQQQPLLLVATAYILTLRLQWDAVLPLLGRIEALLANQEIDRGAEERVVAEALLTWIWAFHWMGELEPEKTRDAAQQALALLPDDHPMVSGLIMHVLTIALQWLGEFGTAERMVNEKLARSALDPSGPEMMLGTLLCMSTLNLAEGHLVHSEQAAYMLLQKSGQMGAENMKVWAYLSLGAAAYYANDLPSALKYYSEGVQLRYGGNILASDQCLVGLALTHQALGQPVEAQGVLTIMRDFHLELANPMLNAEFRSLQARVALQNGNIATARQWNDDIVTDAGLVFGWIVVPAITNVRIRLADQPSPDDLREVLTELDRLLGRLANLRQPIRQVELLSLKAVAWMALEDRRAAALALEEALTLAEPRGLIRPIVDAGTRIEPLVQALHNRQPSPYLVQLLTALRSPSASGEPRTQPVPHLTPREREVLVLLSQYCTDRVIAETLVVSPLTVRTHIENLSEKLGVRGRRTIVDRAKELALLP